MTMELKLKSIQLKGSLFHLHITHAFFGRTNRQKGVIGVIFHCRRPHFIQAQPKQRGSLCQNLFLFEGLLSYWLTWTSVQVQAPVLG